MRIILYIIGDKTLKIRNLMLSHSCLLLAALALPAPAFAVQGLLSSTVLGVLVNSEPLPPPATTGLMFGGCMVYLSSAANAASPQPNCPDHWVSLSCDGTYAAKDVASLMLDQAQLAWATKRQVLVKVDDTKLHNGYCTATRLDVW